MMEVDLGMWGLAGFPSKMGCALGELLKVSRRWPSDGMCMGEIMKALRWPSGSWEK